MTGEARATFEVSRRVILELGVVFHRFEGSSRVVIILIEDAFDFFEGRTAVEYLHVDVFQAYLLRHELLTLDTALCTSPEGAAFAENLHIFLTQLVLLEVWGHLAEAFYGVSLEVARVVLNTAADATHCLWRIVILQYLDLALSKCL